MSYKPEQKFEPIELGSKVVVSDPCYDRNTWCMGFVDNVLEGKYVPILYSWKEEEPRVKEIKLIHEKEKETEWVSEQFSVGVDSGQAGVFCDSIYPQGDPGEYDGNGGWYDTCCNATMQGYNELDEWHQIKRDMELGIKNPNHTTFMIEYYKELLEDIARQERGEETVNNFFPYSEKELKEKINIIENGIMPEKPEWVRGGTVYGKGFVSCTGFGDGGYTCYTCKNTDGKVIGFKIVYIEDETQE